MKKTTKSILSGILAALLLALPVSAAELTEETPTNLNEIILDLEESSTEEASTEEKITIAFKLGESVLKINGTDVPVTTPFEENGTTLVPVRVITEAFGAKVDWIESEQGVVLTYNDVVIKIWINKTEAYVNDAKSELLLAPQLVNSTTMVPLRFITENFGADVSYEDATGAILVEKVITSGDAVADYSAIFKNSDKPYIGDSYFGWRINRDENLKISYRNFDGSSMNFNSSGDNGFSLIILERSDEDDRGKDFAFNTLKDYATGRTIVRQNENKDIFGNDYLEIEAKAEEFKYFYKAVVGEKYVYVIIAVAEKDAADELFMTVRTFTSYDGNFDEIADLSEVDHGKRVYENKDMRFSLELPAEWQETSDKDIENEIYFSNSSIKKDEYSKVFIGIQSLDNIKSIEDWANTDYNLNVSAFNPDYATFTEVSEYTIAGLPAIHYTYEANLVNEDIIQKVNDIFFVNGDYAYNVSFTNYGDDERILEQIEKSFKFDIIDKSDIGSMLIPGLDESFSAIPVSGKFTVKSPDGWEAVADQAGTVVIGDSNCAIGVYYLPKGGNAKHEAESAHSYYKETLKSFKSRGGGYYINRGGKTGYTSMFEHKTDDGDLIYHEVFYFNVNGSAEDCIMVSVNCDITYYGDYYKNIIDKVIGTIELK